MMMTRYSDVVPHYRWPREGTITFSERDFDDYCWDLEQWWPDGRDIRMSARLGIGWAYPKIGQHWMEAI